MSLATKVLAQPLGSRCSWQLRKSPETRSSANNEAPLSYNQVTTQVTDSRQASSRYQASAATGPLVLLHPTTPSVDLKRFYLLVPLLGRGGRRGFCLWRGCCGGNTGCGLWRRCQSGCSCHSSVDLGSCSQPDLCASDCCSGPTLKEVVDPLRVRYERHSTWCCSVRPLALACNYT